MANSVRRIALGFLLTFSAAGLPAAEITSADLQIQGVGLKVITVSVTTGLEIPAVIQTEFGGKQNDQAPVVEGLVAAGELSGPGIDVPIRIETAPGHKFQVPGLSREGVYFLQNIRLMKDGEFLQAATPSVATITVTNLLQTSVRVRQLTPEEIRARGISIDARNYDVYEYVFSFLIDDQIVEIPFPVIIDPRTHEVREVPDEADYRLPPVDPILPPRWEPPEILTFDLYPPGDAPGEEPPADGGGGGGGRPAIPAALIIPNNMAVLHQFFAVALMVTNGAPDGSEVKLDDITAMIKPPAPLRVAKSIPSVAFNQPVPIVDATTGVTFLVAQAKGEAEWTLEGLQPGTHTVEVEVRATYKAPGQNDFPLKGNVRASVVVHDPRFNINFSHPDVVREGIEYSTYSFITNMSAVTQNIRVTNGVPACSTSPGSNVCRVDGTPEFHDLSIPAGEMRTIEYKLIPGVTGQVFATAGSVSDDNITASVSLHMGVSESGIPLSPATLIMPYYSRFVAQPMVSTNLQILGLGYSLATAPLTPALAKHPHIIKSDVFHRATDIARAGQRVFLGEPMRDALAHMTLDLLGNALELREWDELRRNEKSGRRASASIARELETALGGGSVDEFVTRFAQVTAWRAPYLLATTSAGKISVRGVTSNARADVASEEESGWVRQLPFAEINRFQSGQMAVVGRWLDDYEITVTPTADGPVTVDIIVPATNDASLLRGTASFTGTANTPLKIQVTRGMSAMEVRDVNTGIIAVGTLTLVNPEVVRIIGSRQDLHLDPGGHKVSVLWNRPVRVAEGDDLLAKLTAQVNLNRDGVTYQGPRPMSAAALQDPPRIANVTFDHALSQNATYTITVAPLVDPLSGANVSFPDALVPVIDNDAPGGILFGHVLKGDNSPIADAEVRLYLDGNAGPPQYDLSRASDGAFLFEFVPRDIDNNLPGSYTLQAVTLEGKETSLNGAVRLPGRVHFVNLVFLGRGSAEGFVRYDNGEVVPEARVVVGSTMFDQFRTTTTDANGRYEVGDLPVGPLTFSATDKDGNVTFAASEIKTPGQVLVQDLSIYRRPFPGVGTIRGVVRRSDTNDPVRGAHVGVYTQGYGLVDGFTDTAGRFEFTKVPSGFVTVLAAEWSVSREATAFDFDLATDETRDLVLTLVVKPAEALVTVEGDVVREDPLFPGDASKYQKVAGAIVKIEKAQAVTADANGHFVFTGVPVSFSTKKVEAYDPATKRSATVTMPQLNPDVVNLLPIFISTANGYGTGTMRVRLLNAAGSPVTGFRVIVPGFPPFGPTPLEGKASGVYELADVPVGAITTVWAIGNGAAPYGDQTATGSVKVEFNGHVAALNLRLPGQGIVRTKLVADIDLIGDVDLTYPAWDEADQALAPKTVRQNTSENGVAGYATFNAVPALQNFTVASAHPIYGYASHSTKLGFDGDVQSIILQLNKLSTVRGVVYAIDGRTPIPGAAVRIIDGRQDQGVFYTQPDGSFVFYNIPASVSFRVVAEITQDGIYRTGVGSGTTPSVGGPVNNVSVILRTQGGVDGRIVYAGFKVFDPQNSANNVPDDTPNDLTDNAPVPLANFSLRELDFPSRSFGTLQDPISADILGRFTINNVFTGALRVTAVDPGNQEIRGAWTGTLTQEGERITAIVGIGAEGFGPVTVRVLDPNDMNAPVLNAEVSLAKATPPYNLFDFATTDGTGTVRFDQVPVGSYKVSAYSKALGKSGNSASFTVVANTGAQIDVVLEFSGRVDGKLSDPEDNGAGVPGAPVTLTASSFQTRASTDVEGDFVFLGVREGTFKLEAKDTQTNRRASASRSLTQADPNPYVSLLLEPTETLHVSVYLPNDTGGNSNILAPLVNLDVRQRNLDFWRELQGNPFVMPGLLENEPYSIEVKEIGGEAREIRTSNSFPNGSASNPLKLVLPAFGSVEVRVVQAGNPAASAKVTVSGGSKSVTVYTDSNGVAIARGVPLGNASVQVVSVDGAFSGSASTTIASQTIVPVVSITLGAYAGVTGLVEAEAGGPSIGTRVIASFSGRVLEMFTDSNGRYTFQGIPTSTTVQLTYMGPNDVTVGARQTVTITANDASKVVVAPTVKLDATPPQVATIVPADGSNNVSPDSSMRITFTEAIPSNQINTNFIQLIPADSTTPVSVTYSSSTNADGSFTVTMTPPPAPAGQQFPLKSNTLYRIIISGEIRDLTGNKIPAARGASFITSDYAEPKVLKVIPSTASALQPATVFEFRFNEPIDPAPWQQGGTGQFHLYKINAPGPTGAIIAEKPGHTFLDPANALALFFTPDDPIEAESFYRIVFSGVRDLQGNTLTTQTFHFFSYDLVKPFVTVVSPVPAEFPLISGVEYTVGVDIRNASASGSTATDVAKVDWFRVDGATQTYLTTSNSAPWSYRFVAPDAPQAGSTLQLAAVATDLSGNQSDPGAMTWQVKPNQPPQNVVVTMTPPDSIYPGNHAFVGVTFEDEGTFATVQVELAATRADGNPHTSSQVKQLTRAKVDDPWPAANFDFDLPPTLKQGTNATFTANVTDVRGLKGTDDATVALLVDEIDPEILTLAPPSQTEYEIGDKYTISAVVKDLETGLAEVVFAFDGKTIKVTPPSPLITKSGTGTWVVSSGEITVSAKNVDTTIPIVVTAKDYNGNDFTKTTEVVYIGVNDPTVPKGAWLCPIDGATYPAASTFSIKLQARATDDISVTAVKFTVPGIADPIAATRVGTTDVYEATANITTPAAGETMNLTVVISDADPTHDITLTIPISVVAIDVTVDNRIQAITPADVASFTNKSILVRGASARLVPHVPVTLANLIVLDGGRVETLSTTTTVEQRLDFTISGRLFIDCASSIDVTARGYLGGYGVNADGSNTKNESSRGRTVGNVSESGPTTYAGASHGGVGGEQQTGVTNAVYGSIANPTDLGTGGGGGVNCCNAGGSGGGAVKLQGGIFAVAGAIRADGAARFGDGNPGSGGSINISATQFVTGPSARITANGGDDDAVNNASRGAGGGRIAIAASERFDVETLGLQIQARGGRNSTSGEAASYLDGGAGTVYLRRPGAVDGELFAGSLDERAPASIHLTRPTPLSGTLVFDRVTLGARALLRADDSIEIGGVVDDKNAATIDPTAVLVLKGELPTITATTTPVAGSALIQASTLNVNYTATSAAGIGTVKLDFSPVAIDRIDSWFSYPGSATPSPAAAITVPYDAAIAPAALVLTATDRAGRARSMPTLSYTIVANTPPVIDKFDIAPATLEVYPGKPINITVSAHDDLKVTKWTLTRTLGTNTPQTNNFIPPNGVVVDHLFSFTVPIETPGGQPYKIDLAVEDAFPSRAPATDTKTVQVLKDMNPPAVTIVSPLNDALFNEGTGNTISVRATITDAEVAVKEAFVQIDTGTPVALTKSGGDYIATIPVPSVDGTEIVSKTLTILAKDYEGNTANPSVNIRIQPITDPNAPVINWACPTSGAMYPPGFTAKLRVFALGNNVGNPANGIQKVELFIGDSTTPLTATTVSGLANYYEVAYPIPSDAVAGSTIAVRAVATNVSGISEGASTSFAIIDGVRITADTTIADGNTTYDNQVVIVQSGTTTIAGAHTFDRLIVLDGAKVTQQATDATTIRRLTFTATTGIFVSCTGSVDVTGRGLTGNANGTGYTYDPATDKPTLTGGSIDYNGASHGGIGGKFRSPVNAPYGSPFHPNTPGGAGSFGSATCASCRPGGGVVRMTTGTLVVDGKILANGQDADAAGAGGSIRIDAEAISGAGEIRADGGGNTLGASGGGGRVAIYYGTLSLPQSNISAASRSSNGNTNNGAAGTVYLRQIDASGAKVTDELIADNRGEPQVTFTPVATAGTGAVVSIAGNVITLSNAVPFHVEGTWIELLDENGAMLAAHEITARTATTVTVTDPVTVPTAASYRGTVRVDRVTARNSALIESDAFDAATFSGSGGVIRTQLVRTNRDVTLTGGANVEVNGTLTAPNLSLVGSTLTHSRATATAIHRLNVDVAGTIDVDAASAIDVSTRGLSGNVNGVGYTYDRATGNPTLTGGSVDYNGGSHGGQGGMFRTPVNAAYGSTFDPNEPGGAGSFGGANCMPCRSGGGVARIRAGALQVDGAILANGENADAAGAGGSIRIDAGTIAGSGAIHADGGSNTLGASGAGGRVAIYYATLSIPAANITALSRPSNSTGNNGAAGTVYLQSETQAGGDLIVDNANRATARTTLLSGVGYATVTASGTDFVTDANAQFPGRDQLNGIRLVAEYDRTITWPIVSNDATTLRLDVRANALAVDTGDRLRGLYRLDTLKLRNAKLDVIDLLEVDSPVDKDAASTISGNNQLPPVIDATRVNLQATATGAAVIGTAGAASDLDVPITAIATNVATANVFSVTVDGNGAFAIPVQGNAGDAITLKLRDANVYPLESPVVSVGSLESSTPVPSQVNKTEWTTDTNFYPRTLARDGAYLTVTSYPTSNGHNDKIVVLNVADPAHPNLVRLLATGLGALRDVVVSNGWAYIGGDRFGTLDVTDPAATVKMTGDPCGRDNAVTVFGGYAFTAELDCAHDGRVNIYDVSSPSTPRYIRSEGVAGFGGYYFTDLHTLGNDYLVGISPLKPGGVGRDVMVIDRRDLSDLKKVSELDVPGFDAFRGVLVDSLLYLVSTNTSKYVVVDLANPAAPVVRGSVSIPAAAAGTAIIGRDAFAAGTSSGLVNLDILDPAAPLLTGTTAIGGNAYDVSVAGAYAYVANEIGVALVPAQVAPSITVTRITTSLTGTTVKIEGAPQSVTGAMPITLELKNVAAGATISGLTVQSDGSFVATLPASPGDPLTIKATDAFGRITGPLSLGQVPFGSTVHSTPITPAMSDSAFLARNVATAGDHLVVASYPTENGSSDKIVIFDVSDRANPVYTKTIATWGAVRDVAVNNGWAFVAADRLVLFDLTSATPAPVYPGDPCGRDNALEIIGGFAFTAELDCVHDGRVNIYDVSTPSQPRYLRSEGVAGFGGYKFSDLTALGTDYLIGVSSDRPGGVGHDIMVIDRRDINDLKKVAELEIANFEAFRAKSVGTTLYVTGVNAGMAVVDMSTPTAPRLVGILKTPGNPRSVDAVGATLGVADGSAGATFVDISPAGMPSVLGNQPTGGTAWECAFSGATLYIANEQGLAVIDSLGTPPLIDRTLITTSSDGASTATVVGVAKAVLGLGPLTLELRNVTTGATVSAIDVATDGSFTTSIPGASGDALTVKVTDSVGRVSGPLTIGTVPFGSLTRHLTISPSMADSNFLARNVAVDGNHLVVSSYPFDNGSSDKIVIFDVTSPANPVYVKTIATWGAVREVLVRDGWAYVAADRLIVFDLTSATTTPIYPGDPCGRDGAIEMAGGYLFTSEIDCVHDGRVNIYDVSTPSAPRYIRSQGVAGFGGYRFTGLVSFGANYLIGISSDRPGGTGRDLMVIDRRDINNLRKVSEFDVPNFDGFRGHVRGNTLYIAGVNGGVAVVDLTNPAAPSLVTVLNAAGAARAIESSGETLAVANGSNGISFVDVSTPSAPDVIGSHAVPGSAWDVALSRGAMYVASEVGLTSIANVAMPPMLDLSLLTIEPAATQTTVTGAADALTGITPITVRITNTATGVSSPAATVSADGSFALTVDAQPGQPISITATDGAGRVTQRGLGSTHGVVSTFVANPSVASNDAGYRARRIASDGTNTVATTGSLWGAGQPTSDKMLFFPQPGAADQSVKVKALPIGGIQDVKISGGFAYVAADRFATIDLSDPALTVRTTGDPCGRDAAVAVVGRYAFTAEVDCIHDGRINVFDVLNPAAPAYVRSQGVAGFGGMIYRSLVGLGTSYLLALSPEKPGGNGHDLIVIDITNVNSLSKAADFDIPNFDALDGVVDGSTLYIAGGDAGVAIVDVTNPLAPSLKSVLNTPGIARGIALAGPNTIVVADAGGPGVTFVDVTSKTAPLVINSQNLAGNITDVDVVGKNVYVAGENQVHIIERP